MTSGRKTVKTRNLVHFIRYEVMARPAVRKQLPVRPKTNKIKWQTPHPPPLPRERKEKKTQKDK
ncbi:hypothetical protein J6590_034009, partial [Homalodisca vitripennis]